MNKVKNEKLIFLFRKIALFSKQTSKFDLIQEQTIQNPNINSISLENNKIINFDSLIKGQQKVNKIEFIKTDELIIQKSIFTIDFDEFLSADNFSDIDFLVSYIDQRYKNFDEIEYSCILKLIINRQWENTLHSKYPQTIILLIKVFCRLKFTKIDVFLKSVNLSEKIGILLNKDSIIALLFNINRLFFTDIVQKQLLTSYSESNAYIHNLCRHNKLNYEINQSEITDLISLTNTLQSVLEKKSPDRVFNNLIEKYDFRREYIDFEHDFFKQQQEINPTFIGDLLLLTGVFYDCFAVHPKLVFEQIEQEEIYTNFELNFSKAMKLFSINELNHYLDLFYWKIILLDEQIIKKNSSPSILTTIINSMKIDVIDLIVFDNYLLFTHLELCRFVYILGKAGYQESIVISNIVHIFTKIRINFKTNLQLLVLCLNGIALLKNVSPFAFFYIENDFIEGFAKKQEFFINQNSLSIIQILMNFAHNCSSEKLWKIINIDEIKTLKMNFREILMVFKNKARFDILKDEDFEYFLEFQESIEVESWFFSADLYLHLEIMDFYFQLLAFLNKKSVKFDGLLFVRSYLRFFESNIDQINELPIEHRTYFFNDYCFLYELIQSNLNIQEDSLLFNSFRKNRSVINNICRNVENVETCIFLDLYLKMGKVCEVCPEMNEDFGFWRRKVYHFILDRLKIETPQNILKILQKVVLSNYIFDIIFIELLEFSILNAFDSYSIQEKCCVLILSFLVWKKMKHQNIECLSTKMDFFAFLISQTMENLHQKDFCFEEFDFRLFSPLKKIISEIETNFNMETTFSIKFEEFLQENGFILELIQSEQNNNIVEFDESSNQLFFGVLKITEILDIYSKIEQGVYSNEFMNIGWRYQFLNKRVSYQNKIDKYKIA